MGLFQDLRDRLAKKKVVNPPSPELVVALEEIRAAGFPHVEQTRFARLWCEIAEIIGIEPLAMRATDRVIDLCPNSKWPVFNAKIQNLEALVLDQSRERPPPSKRMETVGDVVDYLSTPPTPKS